MKPPYPPRYQSRTAHFPALHGRASLKRLPRHPGPDRLRHFPALHGRASLKRRAVRGGGGGPRDFPALHGRASLKHSRRPPRPGGRGRHFPALHGRASLKRHRMCRPGRLNPHFPALHGRASLKQQTRNDFSTGPSIFSRPSRAGLIEASKRPPRAARGRPLFSRPSRAGLIEAPGGHRGRVGVRPHFPALHGRASLKHSDAPPPAPRPTHIFPPFTGGPH